MIGHMVSVPTIRCFQTMIIEESEPQVVSADTFAFDRKVFCHVYRYDYSDAPIIPVITFRSEINSFSDKVPDICLCKWRIHNLIQFYVCLTF